MTDDVARGGIEGRGCLPTGLTDGVARCGIGVTRDGIGVTRGGVERTACGRALASAGIAAPSRPKDDTFGAAVPPDTDAGLIADADDDARGAAGGDDDSSSQPRSRSSTLAASHWGPSPFSNRRRDVSDGVASLGPLK